MQAGTCFPKVRRMLLCFFLFDFFFWPASPLLHGHIAFATQSLLETAPQILERWGCAEEVHVGKYIRAKDCGLEFWCEAQKSWKILHVGFLHVCAFPEKSFRRRHVLKYATQLPCIR